MQENFVVAGYDGAERLAERSRLSCSNRGASVQVKLLWLRQWRSLECDDSAKITNMIVARI